MAITSNCLMFDNQQLLYDGTGILYNEDPLNPLNLPSYTIRLLYKDGVTPEFEHGTAIHISNSPNIWDLTYNNTNWQGLLSGHKDLLEVLGINSTGVTITRTMFQSCDNLRSVSLFDTSSVTNMLSMFHYCGSLRNIPLFNTSNVTDIRYAFKNCFNVKSGALALYQQVSSQTNPPSNYTQAFRDCGSWTTTGAAELAQIPSNWK